MAQTEVEILNIDTSQSVRSIADLKAEVKALKDQLVTLEAGTEEYNEVLVKVANRQHELVEITEQVKQSSQDFGDRMANVAGAIGGVSGAVQTVTGALSLMGVEIGDDAKLMKTLVSAMSITSGITAIDKGMKAVKALTVSLKASTAAAGGLGKALKALALSNPFTAILAAVVAVTAAVVALTKAIGNAREAQARLQQAFDNKQMLDAYNELETKLNTQVEMMKIDGQTDYQVFLQKKANAKALRDQAEQNLNHYLKIIQTGSRAERKAAEEFYQIWSEAYDKRAADYQALIDQTAIEEHREEKRREAEQEAARRARQQRAQAAASAAAAQKKAELAQIAKIERDAQIALMDAEDAELAKLKDTYDEQVRLYQKRGQDISTLTAKYEKERQAIIDKYIAERVQKDIEAAEKEEERAANKSAALVRLLEKQMADEQAIYDRMQIETDNRLAKDYTEEKVEEAEAMMESAYMALLQRKIELEQQLLQSEALTDEDREVLQDSLLQHQKERAELSVQIEQKALEKRKALYQNYAKAVNSITSSITSILGTIGGTLEEGSKQWKAVKIAEATISTIQGGVAAYMGMVESIPGPAGLIAGAVAAAATVAAGMAEVAKIRNTEISTGGSSGTASTTTALGSVKPTAVQVAATQVTNTRQTSTTSDIEELPDTKVYVLESDITNAQRNVKTTVEQATF